MYENDGYALYLYKYNKLRNITNILHLHQTLSTIPTMATIILTNITVYLQQIHKVHHIIIHSKIVLIAILNLLQYLFKTINGDNNSSGSSVLIK